MKDYIKLAGTLCLITLICALCLSGVNALTKDAIEKAALETQNNALRSILTDASEFNEIQEGIFEGKNGNITVGYCVNTTASGFGGDISMMVGVNPDGTLAGIEILSHGETAGLGAKCEKDDFKSQFAGKTAPLSVIKSGTASSNQIQAITGATITSTAVSKGVNNAVELLQSAGLLEGGNN